MDNNMINIDDLLKQRLGDAEERERAGAWTNMRDLLDQQMPVNAGASTNWRRMFFYVAGVALLAAISVGGYQMVESFSADGTGTRQLADNGSNNTSYTGVVNTAMSTLPDTRKEMVVEEPTQSIAPVKAADVVASTTSTKASRTVAKTTQQSTAAEPQRTLASSGNSNNTKANTVPLTAPPSEAINNSETNTDVAQAKTTQPAQVEEPTVATQKVTQQEEPVTSAPTATEPISNDESTTPVRAQEEALAKIDATEAQEVENTEVNEPQFDEERRQYKKVVLKQSINENGELEEDTIFNGTDEYIVKRERKSEPSAVENIDDVNSGASMMPSSVAPNNNATQNLNSASNNNGNVKAKKDRGSKYTNPRRFEEMVKNAKLSMGKVKFYPGIVAGANTAFSGANISGFQLGLAGKLTINERWSILTEAKYNQRFNGNERLQNDYITNVQTVAIGGQPLIKYDSVEHYYNFNTLGSIEMPISLSYNYKRAYVFGGVNLTYNFRINNIQEVETPHGKEANATSTNVNIASTGKTVLLSDFKPTFGLGYVAGAGFEFSNRVKVDLRLTQPLFMNTNTPGQKILADKVYKIPSLQGNLTFRIGGNKFKPYKKR